MPSTFPSRPTVFSSPPAVLLFANRPCVPELLTFPAHLRSQIECIPRVPPGFSNALVHTATSPVASSSHLFGLLTLRPSPWRQGRRALQYNFAPHEGGRVRFQHLLSHACLPPCPVPLPQGTMQKTPRPLRLVDTPLFCPVIDGVSLPAFSAVLPSRNCDVCLEATINNKLLEYQNKQSLKVHVGYKSSYAKIVKNLNIWGLYTNGELFPSAIDVQGKR